MSDLLNDSATASKLRDKILAELHADEEVFYAVEGQVIRRPAVFGATSTCGSAQSS
jgi:hypothetical protein